MVGSVSTQYSVCAGVAENGVIGAVGRLNRIDPLDAFDRQDPLRALSLFNHTVVTEDDVVALFAVDLVHSGQQVIIGI